MVGEKLTRSRMRMRLLKVQTGTAVECAVVGAELASLRLHWIGGRSYVCPGGDCPACMEVASRWAGFVPVLVSMGPGSPKGVLLLEVTESAWARFDGLCRLEQDRELFGMRIAVMRRRVKEPLCIDPLGRADLGERKPIALSTCYDALATLYGLTSVREGETVGEWSSRAESGARHALELAIARLT